MRPAIASPSSPDASPGGGRSGSACDDVAGRNPRTVEEGDWRRGAKSEPEPAPTSTRVRVASKGLRRSLEKDAATARPTRGSEDADAGHQARHAARARVERS